MRIGQQMIDKKMVGIGVGSNLQRHVVYNIGTV